MGLFKWLKKRKEREIERAFADIENDLMPPDEAVRKTGDQTIEHCERIVELAHEYDDAKSEYKIVTSYLNDIEVLAGLSDEESKEITDIASQMETLNQTRENYLHMEKKLTDAQFMRMEQEEDRIPEAIIRLEKNEIYLETLVRDMNYLDGEKISWEYVGEDMREERTKLRHIGIALFSAAIFAAALLFVLQLMLKKDLTIFWIVMVLAFALGIVAVFVRYQNNQKEAKQANANKNRAIILLNKVKIKYVNVKNAVDYACENYHVHHSKELKKQWEDYMEAKREREKYIQTNEDLEYYTSKLLKALGVFHLYDSRVWLNQTHALVDEREMVEIKHQLITRRQKLRRRMEHATEKIGQQKEEIEKLIEKHPQNANQIRDIVASIDKMIGA